MRKIMANTVWSVVYAFKNHPVWTVSYLVSVVCLSLFPALQMEAVTRLVEHLGQSQDEVLPLALGVSFVLAGYIALGQASDSLRMILNSRMSSTGIQNVSSRLATCSSQEIASGDYARSSRAAHEAVTEGSLGSQVSTMGALIFIIFSTGSLSYSVGKINVYASLCMLAGMIPVALMSHLYSSKNAEAMEKIYSYSYNAWHSTNQIAQITTARELAILNARSFFAHRANQERKKSGEEEIGLARYILRIYTIVGFISAALLALALIFLAASVPAPGALAGAVIGITSAIVSLGSMGSDLSSMAAGSNAIDIYRKFISSAQPKQKNSVADTYPEICSVSIRNLAIQYPKADSLALKNINLTFGPGQMIGIVGPSGSGKTTLVNALMGMLKPSSGDILIGDKPVQDISPDDLLANVGLVSQDYGRYELTVRENLLLGLPQEAVERLGDADLWSALSVACADDFVRGLEGGLDAQLGESFGGVGLSGGQWQRLALARVVLRDAPVWVLDEPTSAVDAETEEEIFARLKVAAGGRLVVLVSHRAWTLRGVDSVVVLDGGCVVEQGTYQDLTTDPTSRFRKLFASQLEGK